MRLFHNRADAGRQLADALADHLAAINGNGKEILILGLARGGVPIANEIPRALGVPFNAFLVRKLGVPGHEELTMGAVASGNIRVLNEDVIQSLAIPNRQIEAVAEAQLTEIARREALFGMSSSAPEILGKTVILVDDGIATGATMRAAIAAVRLQQPAQLIVAVGVAPPEACHRIEPLTDQFVCLLRPRGFWSVGMWYEDFRQVTDNDVRELLQRTNVQMSTT